jgi:N-acetylmuramic acid 6-phosphate etherase
MMAIPDTEASSDRFADMDAWDTPTILAALWEGQLAAVAAIGSALPALSRAVEAAADRLRLGGRLAYVGAGTSGRIGVQDAVELVPTFGWPAERLLTLMAGGEAALLRSLENVEDQDDQGAAAVQALGSADVLVGLAASGGTRFTVAAVREARLHGCLTIGMANSPVTPLLEVAELAVLLETGAETVAGSTRMKAGTAQKAALNLFSTALMTRLGRVYRGQMVDMLARNDKLRQRAERMLVRLAGVSDEVAREALDTAGGTVKVAMLVLRGMTRGAAEALLARHGGDLRRALAEAGMRADGADIG